MKKALIIFVRNPQIGKVKTRLAATLGNEMALYIYQKLLEHTLRVTEAVEGDKIVFYAGEIVIEDIWERPGYIKRRQADGDLGGRMTTAFETVLAMGYSKVCIVGSDCYELSSGIVSDAFTALSKSNVVIGPAHDGGYYLLGMKQLYPALFHAKNWSTNTVLKDTLQTVAEAGLTVTQLPHLHDVDEAEDVPKEWLTEVKR